MGTNLKGRGGHSANVRFGALHAKLAVTCVFIKREGIETKYPSDGKGPNCQM